MATESVPDRGNRLTVLVGGILVIATLAVFGHVCANGFVNYDDPQYVTGNPHVLAGLRRESVRWAFTSTEESNWHPLTWLSLQLDHHLFGLRPWGYHLTNLLLHTANTLLLFLILYRLTGTVWPSALVAALFALHPLHVESVAWVAERKDVLSTLLGLLALAAYLRYVQRPSLRTYVPVALALGLSLMAKAMLVTLPGILLLLDYWPLGRLRLGGTAPPAPLATNPAGITPAPVSLGLVLGEKVPLLALAAVASVVTVFAQQHGGAVEPLESLPLGLRAGNAVVCYVRYLGMTLWPSGLAPFYPHPRAALPAWQPAVAAVLLLGLTALALASARRRPYLAVGWLWYLGTLVPVIGLVQVGEQALADRYTYVPLIGVFILVAWGLADLLAQRPALRPVAVAAAATVLVACAALTWRQAALWHDSRALWEHTLAVTPENHVTENNLGAAYLFGQDTLPMAEEHLRQAVRIKPDRARPWTRLGIALDKQGRGAEAAVCYAQSLELQPDQPQTHNNLAVALVKQGQLEEAITHLQEATRQAPDFAEAHHNLAFALARAKRLDEAVAACERCVRLEPGNEQYRLGLAALLRQHGDIAAAAAQLREAERLHGGFP